jgi:hypothetical protein
MSRPASRSLSRGLWCAAASLAIVAPPGHTQTIADYSRAQRAVLENAMTQAAARSAGLGAAAPATTASVPVPPAPASAPAHAGMPPPAASVEVSVSGVFASSSGAIAEVVVNSTPYLLEAGERVPGTAWEVRVVAVDRVVLARQGGGPTADSAAGLRVFALPALR